MIILKLSKEMFCKHKPVKIKRNENLKKQKKQKNTEDTYSKKPGKCTFSVSYKV